MVNVRVLISGVHDSYPSINTATKDQKLEQCVTAMDICIHSAKKLFGTCNPFVHHVEMTLDEVPLHEEQTSDHPFYCLFLSAPER
jgi:hypothetical protein